MIFGTDIELDINTIYDRMSPKEKKEMFEIIYTRDNTKLDLSLLANKEFIKEFVNYLRNHDTEYLINTLQEELEYGY